MVTMGGGAKARVIVGVGTSTATPACHAQVKQLPLFGFPIACMTVLSLWSCPARCGSRAAPELREMASFWHGQCPHMPCNEPRLKMEGTTKAANLSLLIVP